jgi:hypothetical protein
MHADEVVAVPMEDKKAFSRLEEYTRLESGDVSRIGGEELGRQTKMASIACEPRSGEDVVVILAEPAFASRFEVEGKTVLMNLGEEQRSFVSQWINGSHFFSVLQVNRNSLRGSLCSWVARSREKFLQSVDGRFQPPLLVPYKSMPKRDQGHIVLSHEQQEVVVDGKGTKHYKYATVMKGVDGKGTESKEILDAKVDVNNSMTGSAGSREEYRREQ